MLDVVGDATVADVALVIQTTADGLVLAAAAVVLLRRARIADAAWRRQAAPVFAGGVATLTVVAALDALSGTGFPAAGGWPADVLNVLSIAIVLVLPLAFVAAISRGGFARSGELQKLVRQLGDAPLGPEGLGAAVANALGDPSAALAFWLPDEGRCVDAGGRPLDPDPSRGVTEVRRDGGRVGAILYDHTLLRGAEPVRSVARVAGLALDHERPAARLRASARELRASRTRLAEAADAERRRIARDLHDGAQQRLVLLAIESQRLARNADDPQAVRRAAGTLRTGLDEALAPSATWSRTSCRHCSPSAACASPRRSSPRRRRSPSRGAALRTGRRIGGPFCALSVLRENLRLRGSTEADTRVPP